MLIITLLTEWMISKILITDIFVLYTVAHAYFALLMWSSYLQLFCVDSGKSAYSFVTLRYRIMISPNIQMSLLQRLCVTITLETRIWADAQRDGRPAPRKCIYSVSAQEMAKHRAKFGWPPMNDVAAVRKPRRETR